MELVLLSPVKSLGNTGDIVKVSRGYATNCLIPQGKAIFSTPEEKTRAKSIRENRKVSRADHETWSTEAAERLTGKTLLFTEKVSSAGHLFGSVTEKDIVERVAKELNVELQKEHVKMEHHIKEPGDHPILIHLSESQEVKLTVRVEAAQ